MDIQFITIKIIDKFTNDLLLVEELTQPGAPKLVYNGADDKYQPIMTAEFSFNLYVKDNADGKFFHLYTGNEKRYYVTAETNTGFIFYEGWLLPDFYDEPFTNSVMFVNLNSTDGIAGLKSVNLADHFYINETDVIKLISECLKQTGLQKKIYLAPSIMSAATDYLWHEIAIDGTSYLDGEIKYTGLFNYLAQLPSRKNCYEILETLCSDLGVTLFGWGDIWYLEGINRKHEEVQSFYEYDFNGNYVGIVTTEKDIININNSFKKDPTISIISPWKKVQVNWEIDEDGDLIPDYAIQDNSTGVLIQLPTTLDMFDFWKASGQLSLQSFSRDLKTKYQFIPNSITFGQSVAPNNLYVVKRQYLNGVTYGESSTNIESNFISIKNKKYLKTSDQYMDRSFDINISINGGDIYSTVGIPSASEAEFSAMFRYDMLSNQTKILSSKNGTPEEKIKRFDCKYVESTIQFSNQIQPGDFYEATADTIKTTLKAEDIKLPNNGFFDIKFHAPISPVASNSRFYGYVIENISIKYTEERKRVSELIRSIDFTTVKKIECIHGDSIQDLSRKQFRFRRPIYNENSLPNINILSSAQLFPNMSWIYHYFISYQDFLNISNNPNSFLVNYNGSQLFFNSDLGSIYFPVYSLGVTFSGNYLLSIDTSLINHPSGIGASISDFNSMGFQNSPSQLIGYEVENNEWRESWKRWGENENKRYGECLGRIYHDVQPKPIVKIEGDIMKIISPRELLNFDWIYNRSFNCTRLTIDFTEGTSNVLLIESVKENIVDYVDE